MKAPAFAKWALALVLAVAATTAPAATLINTMPAWNGTQFISTFGVPNTQTYGQVVVVPAGETSLTSFSFVINDQGTALTMLGEVYAWNGSNMATGAALFESAPVTTGGVNAFQTFTFTIPGGVAVTAGQQLILFATTSKSAQTNSGSRWGAIVDNSAYPGGQFYFQNNGTSTATWTSVAWNTITYDLAFTAGFGGATPATVIKDVPTLSGWMLTLLGAGLAAAGLGFLRFRGN